MPKVNMSKVIIGMYKILVNIFQRLCFSGTGGGAGVGTVPGAGAGVGPRTGEEAGLVPGDEDGEGVVPGALVAPLAGVLSDSGVSQKKGSFLARKSLMALKRADLAFLLTRTLAKFV